MARGTWEDFTSKFGFNDGDSVGDEDYKARHAIVTKMNAHPLLVAKGLRAVPFNRPGLHNDCMIRVHKHKGRSDEEILLSREPVIDLRSDEEILLSNEPVIDLENLPGRATFPELDIDEIVAQAYEEVFSTMRLDIDEIVDQAYEEEGK